MTRDVMSGGAENQDDDLSSPHPVIRENHEDDPYCCPVIQKIMTRTIMITPGDIKEDNVNMYVCIYIYIFVYPSGDV